MTYNPVQLGQKTMANSTPVVIASDETGVPVTGTFWQATQPVSGTFWQATQPVSIAASVAVTGTFWQATQPVSLAAGATAIAKAEDVASADADVGVPSMAVRKATPANTSGTDGDYEMLQMSAGRLWVDASGKTLTVDASGVTQPANVFQINGVTPLMGNGVTGTGSQRVTIASDNTAFSVNSTDTGNVAHDGVDSGNPVKVGGKGRTTNPTAVSDGDRTDLFTDTAGRPVVVNNQCRNLVGIQQTTITASTSETTIIPQVASTFLDLTHLSITNSSATATLVTLKDSTAGTTRGIWSIAANGGIVLAFNTPIPQATVNTNWTLTCGTSVSSIYVVAEYVKNV